MKNKWIIALLIFNTIVILSILSLAYIWKFDKREENLESTQKTEETKTIEQETPANNISTPSSDDIEIIRNYNRKYSSTYDIVVSRETDSNYISQVKKVVVNLSIIKLNDMNTNNRSSEINDILHNLRNDITKDLGNVSVTFRASQENAPFYMIDIEGNGHILNNNTPVP
ncbi:hypothetical protein ACT7DB_19130 [Bacillus cereus]